MGIRQNISLIMGVADLETDEQGDITDRRWTLKDNYWESYEVQFPFEAVTEEHIADMTDEGMDKLSIQTTLETWKYLKLEDEEDKNRPFYLSDIMYQNSGDFGHFNILGIELENFYDNDLILAMMALDPKRYESRIGYHVFKSKTVDEAIEDKNRWAMCYKLWEAGKAAKHSDVYSMAMMMQKLLDTNQNHGLFSYSVPWWAMAAHYILTETLKFNVALNEMSLILAWDMR